MANTSDDALEMLAHAEATQRAVRKRTAWDYRVYFAWGIWLLIFIPPLDFINGSAWGIVISVASGVGTLLTVAYFSALSRQVHLRRAMRLRRWFLFWALWAVWYAAWIVLASVYEDDIHVGFTLAGIAGSIPCFIAGYLSWRSR